jgi:hypothetical protein
MKKSLIALSLLFAFNAQAADLKPTATKAAVKKSSTGVCHTAESRHHAKLKNFTPYDTLKACLDSGGHLPGKKAKG